MSDLIRREDAINALSMMQGIVAENGVRKGISMAWQQIADLPPAQPTLYGYDIEHLALIARVMEKEGITPGEVAELLRNAGKISEMAVDVVQKVHKKSMRDAVRRIDDDPSHPFADGVMMKE